MKLRWVFASDSPGEVGVPHWDIKTKTPEPVKLDLPLFWCPSAGIVISLPSSMADFVPRDP